MYLYLHLGTNGSSLAFTSPCIRVYQYLQEQSRIFRQELSSFCAWNIGKAVCSIIGIGSLL